MYTSVTELGGGISTYLFRRAEVKEDYLLFASDTLSVTAVSQETMALMGVCPCSLRMLVKFAEW